MPINSLGHKFNHKADLNYRARLPTIRTVADRITRELIRNLLPERPAEGHKGTFGHAYLIAGSRGFTGAAKLAALGAARSGAGLVTVGVPRSLGDVVAAGLLECMTMLLPATPEETLSRAALEPALAFAEDKSAAGIGPGLSQHAETREFVLGFAKRCPVPFVIDADGLNALSHNVNVLKDRQAACVLTPHPGEMARLIGLSAKEVQGDRELFARELARAQHCVVVLKGRGSIVAGDGGDTYVNTTGNNGLATGGTGDVLTGLIAGLLAQGLSGLDAALVGVYVHGLAGDLAAKAKSERGMIAGDVLDCLPEAWLAVESKGRSWRR